MRSADHPWDLMRRLAAGIAVLGLCVGPPAGAAASSEVPPRPDAPFVCAQVVLAIDGSESTGDGAFRRQIEAFRAAFASEELYRAIQDCLPGSVAFAVMSWSGSGEQELCVGWSVITDPADGRRLAAELERCRYFGGTTDIGRAVDYGLSALDASPFASFYRGVLVLTNGRTDRGGEASLSAARAQAATAGVTLAAHALLRSRSRSGSPFLVPDRVRLESYVAEHVSAGPRSFSAYSRPDDDGAALLRALVTLLRQEGT